MNERHTATATRRTDRCSFDHPNGVDRRAHPIRFLWDRTSDCEPTITTLELPPIDGEGFGLRIISASRRQRD